MEFEGLVKRLTPTIKRITHKLNGRFTFFDDDDLYQEALIRLLGDFRSGKLRDKTDSYILQGCYFHLKNYIRKTEDKVRPLSLNIVIHENGEDLEEILISREPLAQPHYGEESIFLQDSRLTERERRLIVLCMEGLTVREIGRRLGISHVMVIKLRNDIRNKYHLFKEELLS